MSKRKADTLLEKEFIPKPFRDEKLSEVKHTTGGDWSCYLPANTCLPNALLPSVTATATATSTAATTQNGMTLDRCVLECQKNYQAFYNQLPKTSAEDTTWIKANSPETVPLEKRQTTAQRWQTWFEMIIENKKETVYKIAKEWGMSNALTTMFYTLVRDPAILVYFNGLFLGPSTVVKSTTKLERGLFTMVPRKKEEILGRYTGSVEYKDVFDASEAENPDLYQKRSNYVLELTPFYIDATEGTGIPLPNHPFAFANEPPAGKRSNALFHNGATIKVCQNLGSGEEILIHYGSEYQRQYTVGKPCRSKYF